MRLAGILLAAAAALVVPVLLLALGTFVPGLPVLGAIGSFVLPPLAGQMTLAAAMGSGCAMIARRARRIPGTLLAVLGVIGVGASALVMACHVRVAMRHGVEVNVPEAFLLRLAADGPDASVPFMLGRSKDLTIDVYRPARDGASSTPVLLYVHGGGWIQGTPRGQAASLRWFANRGYLVLSAAYDLATDGSPTWDTAGAQVTCALAWISKQAAAYGGDPSRLFGYGESAGGALLLTAAYRAALDGRGCDTTLPRFRAVAAEYPAVDPASLYDNPDLLMGRSAREMVHAYLGGTPQQWPERARAVSTSSYVSAKAPPTLVLLGGNDHLVPVDASLRFAEQARSAGVQTEIVNFPLADHTLNLQYHGVANQAMRLLMQRHFCRHGGACTP